MPIEPRETRALAPGAKVLQCATRRAGAFAHSGKMPDQVFTTRSNRGTAMRILTANRNLTPFFGFKTTTPASRIKESGVSHMKSNSQISLSHASWMTIVLLMLTLPLPALAALGGDISSVQQDKAQMKGTLKTTENDAYTVHEITAAGNTIVKEYVSPAGKVFAITWRGQFIPNMQQLLGTYFDQYASAAQAQRTAHRGRAPLNIQQPGLVVESNGHMRSYSGRVYDPGKLPQGVNANDIR
jgi:hypothetical protein